MIKYKKHIQNFNKKKNNIKQSVVLVGCGRWGKVLLNEILYNFKNIEQIYVVTNYQKNLQKWINKKRCKNIKILKNFNEIKKINCRFAIVAKKNEHHYHFCKKLLNGRYNVLVEKPFVNNIKKARYLLSLSIRKNFFLLISLPFFYAHFFYYIKEKIITNLKVLKFTIYWFDKKKEIRYGSIKKHDRKLNQIEDIFYHIYSIINIFLGKGNFSFQRQIMKYKKYRKLVFNYNYCNVEINFSKNWPNRKRILNLELSNGKNVSINFINNNVIKTYYDKKMIKLPEKVCQKTLKYQLFSFFNLRNFKIKNNVNDIRNLKNLLISLEKLKKYL
jgi:hypothetical protein